MAHIYKSALILFCAALLLPAPARAQDITSGLIGHWKLDETSGTFADSSGNGNAGTLNGDVEYSAPGMLGKAAEFDGGRISIANEANFDFQRTDPFTLAAWVYITFDASHQAIISKDGQVGSNFPGYTFEFDGIDNRIMIDLVGSTGSGCWGAGNCIRVRTNANIVQTEGWHHVLATYDGSSSGSGVKIYLDGESKTVNVTEDALSTSMLNNASVGIGAMTSTLRPFRGRIDDARIYNRALTAEDVLALYKAGNPGHIRYNSSSRAPEYFDGIQWIPMGRQKYVPNAISLPNPGDYLHHGSALAGVSDGQTFTGSFWIKLNAFGVNQSLLQSDTTEPFKIQITNLDRIRFTGYDSSNTLILSVTSTSFTDTDWHHVMFSFDLSDVNKRHVYIDGVDAFGGSTAYTNSTLDLDSFIIWRIANQPGDGSGPVFSQPFNGALADYWIDFGTYIDLSDPENRRKFYDNGPVYLGANGGRPTGSPPDIFLSGSTDTWHTNKGTGGGFTENGALTDAQGPGQNITWAQVGSSLSIGAAVLPAATTLDSQTVAYIDENNDRLRTYRWDGTAWSLIGNTLSIAVDDPDITALDSTTVAVAEDDADTLTTYRWDGTDWSQVGNALTIAGCNWPAVTALDSNTIAYIDDSNDQLRTYGWDGSDWSQIGNSLAIASLAGISITALDSTTIALIDANAELLRTYSWNGTNWSQTGSSLSIPGIQDPVIAALDSTTIAFSEPGADILRTYVWSGDSWSQKGLTFSAGSLTAIAALNRDTIALVDGTADTIRTYEFAHCSNPNRSMGSIIYNATTNQMQFCNGEDWIAMNAPGDGGAGCMNPTGVAGQMIFNSATNYMQYCEGSDWMKVGLRGIPTDGLIGYWPFDDGTGSTTAEDVIGTTDGTLNNMDANTDWVDGIMGGGLDLDGNDDYISLGDYAGIEGVSALTISIWVKNHKTQILATGNERIIDKNGAGNDTLQLTWQQSEDMHFSIQTNAGAGNDLVAVYTDGPPPGSANQWHHIVGVYDGLEIKLYVNGVLGSVTQPHTQLTNNTAHALLIGTDEGAGEGWDGVVDELRIYNRALSPAEVYDLYLGTGGN